MPRPRDSEAQPPARAVLATDLDGTLLRDDGTVSERTRQALRRANSHGVRVVFITGRPPMFVASIRRDSGHAGTIICANGAVWLDGTAGEPVRVESFASAVVPDLWRRLAQEVPEGEFRTMVHRSGDPGRRVIGSGDGYADEIAALLDEGWVAYKLALVGTRWHTFDGLMEQASTAVGDQCEVTFSTRDLPLIELGPRGVTKGSALRRYAQSLGVDDEHVHAVGDMPNDVPMMGAAGRSYAVANAHEELHRVVDEVLPSNTDDGVAHLIDRLASRYGRRS